MNDRPSTEARIAALITAYADGAPTGVDPAAMARLAASRADDRAWWGRSLSPLDRGLAVLLLVGSLIVALVAGMAAVGAGPFRRHATDLLTSRASVEPFVGLAPVGAPPSDPETGDLLVHFAGRPDALGEEFYRMWLYGDGRLIWTSEGGAGGRTLPNAVVEQRLTPQGVELVRSMVAAGTVRVRRPASAGDAGAIHGGPGVLWGSMTAADGGELVDIEWTPRLAEVLEDPVSWLPADAWADARIRGYVPSRYAVCAWTPGTAEQPEADSAVDRLPEAVRTLVLGTGTPIAGPTWDDGCYEVPTATAQAIAATLAGDRRRPDAMGVGPRFDFPTGDPSGQGISMDLVPITPHGDVVCNCG
jgi:hypothetical protein